MTDPLTIKLPLPFPFVRKRNQYYHLCTFKTNAYNSLFRSLSIILLVSSSVSGCDWTLLEIIFSYMSFIMMSCFDIIDRRLWWIEFEFWAIIVSFHSTLKCHFYDSFAHYNKHFKHQVHFVYESSYLNCYDFWQPSDISSIVTQRWASFSIPQNF